MQIQATVSRGEKKSNYVFSPSLKTSPASSLLRFCGFRYIFKHAAKPNFFTVYRSIETTYLLFTVFCLEFKKFITAKWTKDEYEE